MARKNRNNTYEEAKYISLIATEEIYKERFNGLVSVGNIDDKTIAKTWEQSPNRRVDWCWKTAYSKYKASNRIFDLSIWYAKSKLCGLTLGTVTSVGDKLRLDLIEATPEYNPVQGYIVDLIFTAAARFCREIGATELRIMEPVNKAVISRYAQFGFRLIKPSSGPKYMTINIKNKME